MSESWDLSSMVGKSVVVLTASPVLARGMNDDGGTSMLRSEGGQPIVQQSLEAKLVSISDSHYCLEQTVLVPSELGAKIEHTIGFIIPRATATLHLALRRQVQGPKLIVPRS